MRNRRSNSSTKAQSRRRKKRAVYRFFLDFFLYFFVSRQKSKERKFENSETKSKQENSFWAGMNSRKYIILNNHYERIGIHGNGYNIFHLKIQ